MLIAAIIFVLILITVLIGILGAGPLATLSAYFQAVFSWSVTGTAPSAAYNAPTAASTLSNKQSLVTGTSTAGQANQIYSGIQTIAASGTLAYDLSAVFTNVLGNAAATFARVKGVLIELLDAAQDATNGTLCSSITLGNSGANDWIEQSHSGWLGSATSVFDVPNGGFVAFGVNNAGGVVVDATHKILNIHNNDGSNAAAVRITLIGADA